MLTVEGQASTLMSCLHRVTHPLGEASEFGREVVELEGLITHLETRVQTTVTILHVALAVPFLGQVAAPVLGPASTVLTKMSDEVGVAKYVRNVTNTGSCNLIHIKLEHEEVFEHTYSS